MSPDLAIVAAIIDQNVGFGTDGIAMWTKKRRHSTEREQPADCAINLAAAPDSGHPALRSPQRWWRRRAFCPWVDLCLQRWKPWRRRLCGRASGFSLSASC